MNKVRLKPGRFAAQPTATVKPQQTITHLLMDILNKLIFEDGNLKNLLLEIN